MLVAHAKRRIHAPPEMVYELLAEREGLLAHWWPEQTEFALTRWPGLGCQQDMVAGPPGRLRCQCYVQTVRGYTQLVHVEELDFAPPWSSLERWLRPLVQRAVDREVDRVKAMVEASLIARLRSPEALPRP